MASQQMMTKQALPNSNQLIAQQQTNTEKNTDDDVGGASKTNEQDLDEGELGEEAGGTKKTDGTNIDDDVEDPQK